MSDPRASTPRPLRRASRAGRTIEAVVGLSALAIMGAVGVSLMTPSHAAAARPDPSDADVAAALVRAGLGPESLASSGVSTDGTAAVVGDARSHLDTHYTLLETADASYAHARQDVERLERVIQGGAVTPENLAELSTARSQLSSAAAARQLVLDEVFASAVAGLAAGQVQTLSALRSNRSWDVPIQYLTSARTEAQWVQLRDALSSVRFAEEYNEQPDAGSQQTKLNADSQPAAAVALVNLQVNLATVTAVWNIQVYGD